MIKLVVTDLDGTLLNDKKEVPERFWEIAHKLFEKDIKLGIATGRPYFSIAENFRAIMDHVFAISDNGSLIVYQKNEILCKPLPQQEIKDIVRNTRPIPNACPILCAKDLAYLENPDDAVMEKVLIYYKHYKIVENLTEVDDTILKVSICDLDGSEQNSYPYFKHFENRLKVAVAGDIWLDITRTDANKGAAVQLLQRQYDITPDETLVFGDFMNDVEMLQAATYSYAMQNAHPQVIKTANYITDKDNNGAGVLKVIEQLCLGE